MDLSKGEMPLAMVVPKTEMTRSDEEFVQELTQLVHDKISPLIELKTIAVLKRLPKTRTGKIFRSTIKKIAEGVEYKVPATMEDPMILEEIRVALHSAQS